MDLGLHESRATRELAALIKYECIGVDDYNTKL